MEWIAKEWKDEFMRDEWNKEERINYWIDQWNELQRSQLMNRWIEWITKEWIN